MSDKLAIGLVVLVVVGVVVWRLRGVASLGGTSGAPGMTGKRSAYLAAKSAAKGDAAAQRRAAGNVAGGSA